MENSADKDAGSEKTGPEKIYPLNTLEADLADTMKQGLSKTAIAAAEAKRQEKDYDPTLLPVRPAGNPETKRYLLAIGTLLALAALTVSISYAIFRPKPKPLPPLVSGQVVIALDSQRILDLTNWNSEELIEALKTERDSSALPANSVLGLSFELKNQTSEPITAKTSDFLPLLAPSAPSGLMSGLNKDFVFGFIGYDGNQPFLILRPDVFQYVYTGMLKWENTMFDDLGGLFAENPKAQVPQSTEQNRAFGKFQDTVISNIDVRELRDTNGKVLITYAFADSETLLITTNEKTFTALLQKLRAVKLSR